MVDIHNEMFDINDDTLYLQILYEMDKNKSISSTIKTYILFMFIIGLFIYVLFMFYLCMKLMKLNH